MMYSTKSQRIGIIGSELWFRIRKQRKGYSYIGANSNWLYPQYLLCVDFGFGDNWSRVLPPYS
jgi:hypothetical protein